MALLMLQVLEKGSSKDPAAILNTLLGDAPDVSCLIRHAKMQLA